LGQAALSAGAMAAVSSLPLAARAVEPKPEKIKIGQIGTAHSHATKLAIYRRSPDYEVVGVVEADPQLRSEAENTSTYRGVRWLTESQLLDTPGLQAVLVETRVRDLVPTAERCIAAGKHVGLDKPPGDSLTQYRRLLEQAEQHKLLVQMGYMFRYNPAVVLLRQFLQEGWLGEVFQVDGVISKTVSPTDRRRTAAYPGGMMFELGCHLIDLLVGVLGKPARVESIARHSSPQPDSLLDNMLAVCEYPRAIATIKSSAQEVDGGRRRQFIVCGTAGTFQIQPIEAPKVRYSLDRDRGSYRKGTHDLDVGPFERYEADAADMARILRGEKPSDYPMAHDLAVQEVVLRASGMPLTG
jgi:predicted dehydrogenase